MEAVVVVGGVSSGVWGAAMKVIPDIIPQRAGGERSR